MNIYSSLLMTPRMQGPKDAAAYAERKGYRAPSKICLLRGMHTCEQLARHWLIQKMGGYYTSQIYLDNQLGVEAVE